MSYAYILYTRSFINRLNEIHALLIKTVALKRTLRIGIFIHSILNGDKNLTVAARSFVCVCVCVYNSVRNTYKLQRLFYPVDAVAIWTVENNWKVLADIVENY